MTSPPRDAPNPVRYAELASTKGGFMPHLPKGAAVGTCLRHSSLTMLNSRWDARVDTRARLGERRGMHAHDVPSSCRLPPFV